MTKGSLCSRNDKGVVALSRNDKRGQDRIEKTESVIANDYSVIASEAKQSRFGYFGNSLQFDLVWYSFIAS